MSKSKKQRDTGDLEEALALARYEIEQDPYRGAMMDQKTGTTRNIDASTSPWMTCVDTDQDCGAVSTVTSGGCPSLVSWTNELEALKRRKKRNKASPPETRLLGRRREDTTFKCRCDYNPFCIVSIGGAMDDFLAQVAKDTLRQPQPEQTQIQTQPATSTNNSSEHDRNEVIVIDDDDDEKSDHAQHGAHAGGDVAPHGQIPTSEKTPAEVFLEDVHFSEQQLDPRSHLSVYAPATKEQLKAIRKEINGDWESILSYADQVIIPAANGELLIEEYQVRLQDIYHQMLFSTPLREIIIPQGRIRLPVPPGMKNLGATCYLNTQLQCLAKNTAFLNGILAWRPAAAIQSRMDTILSSLQLILARLAYGSESEISTLDFSEALGLATDEQQDPNEFADLLFQRMHTAFQGCSRVGSNAETSLATLLPSLFEGCMTYETQCCTCGRVTQRRENFMNLLLPIVIPKPEETVGGTKNGNGQKSVLELLNKPQKKELETSVQYCLDNYLRPEDLCGDNQYSCEICSQKRDATRRVVLEKLPPVLNIQLCRYVYDRNKHAKKKLKDRVVLPAVINVSDGENSNRYRLCAVMRHLGESAYRGHYIAEAMEWLSGVWWEFNDEKVTELKGPSSSVDSSGRGKKKGSQDAYNMYYVREDFLGTCVVKSLANTSVVECNLVEKKIASERGDRYDMLTEMCRNDSRVANVMMRRKRGLLLLLNQLFRLDSLEADFSVIKFQDSVWVNESALRSYFACQTTNDWEHLFSNEQYFCSHGNKLSPSSFCAGKVISKPMYEKLISLIQSERKFVANYEALGPKTRWLPWSVHTLSCTECSGSHTGIICHKLQVVQSLRELHLALDPQIDLIDELQEDETIYALSKQFVTKFRNVIQAALKPLETLDTFEGGLENLVLPSFADASLSSSAAEKACEPCPVESQAKTANDLDNFVNTKIACENKSCCPINKRSVRYVPQNVWLSLKNCFPLALTLEKPRRLENVWVPCESCKSDTVERAQFNNWATLGEVLPPQVLQGKYGQTKDLPNIKTGEQFFIVDKKETKRLFNAMKKTRNANIDLLELKADLREILFSGNTITSEHSDFQVHFLQLWCPIPLICSTHGQTLPTIFSFSAEETWRFTNNVVYMSPDQYKLYVIMVTKIFVLVFPNLCPRELHRNRDDCSNSSFPVDAALTKDLERSYHPRINLIRETVLDDSLPEDSYQTCFFGNDAINVSFSPKVCRNHLCRDSCTRDHECSNGDAPMLNEAPMFIDVDENDAKANGDNISFRLLEVEEGSEINEILRRSHSSMGESSDLTMRRSSRRRKQRVAFGPIKSDDIVLIRKDHNMAALRLHFLEQQPSFKLDQNIFLVVPYSKGKLPPGETTNVGEKKVTIPFEWNHKLVQDVVKEAVGVSVSEEEVIQLMSSEDMILYRYQNLLSAKRSKSDTDGSLPQEVLMDALLQAANLSDEKSKMGDSKKKDRRVERGFTGTFLSSSLAAPVASNMEQSQTNATSADEFADLTKAKAPSATLQPSSEECVIIEDDENHHMRKTRKSTIHLDCSDTEKVAQEAPVDLSTDRSATKRDSMDAHGVVMDRLASMLSDDNSETLDQFALFEAVSWACTQAPTEPVDHVCDMALSKYLENR